MNTQLRPVEKSSTSASIKHRDKISKRTEWLDDLLLGMVDETLKQVFREEGAEVIYDYLGNKCHLKRQDIAKNPEDFSAGLRGF